jgi:hypothetical protein
MDYKNGKIYTIRSHQTDKIYIGSTTQTLTKRLSKHKGDFKCWKNGKYHYVSSFDIVKYEDSYIELLELCPCDSKMQLHKREGELIREMDFCINKNVAGRKTNEYHQENKNKIKIQKKEYYQDHKEKIKEKVREYSADNKYKIKIQKKEYYETNKNKIKHKYDCNCGGKYTHQNKSTHLKSNLHQAYILNVEKPLK